MNWFSFPHSVGFQHCFPNSFKQSHILNTAYIILKLWIQWIQSSILFKRGITFWITFFRKNYLTEEFSIYFKLNSSNCRHTFLRGWRKPIFNYLQPNRAKEMCPKSNFTGKECFALTTTVCVTLVYHTVIV